jgi:exopolysaccharide biosynthesis polyprenyl glycosylphosphotransferase
VERRFTRLAALLMLGDALLTTCGLLIASWLRESLPFGKPLGPEGAALPLLVYLLSIACWSGVLFLSGAYDVERGFRLIKRAPQIVTAGATATIFLAGLLYLTYREVSRLQFIYAFLLNLALLLSFRILIYLYLRRRSDSSLIQSKNVVIVGAGDLGCEIARVLKQNPVWGYRLVGFLDDNPAIAGDSAEGYPVLGDMKQLLPIIEKYAVAEVWSTLPPRAYDRLHALVSMLETIPIRIKVIPDYFSLALVQAQVEMLGGFPIIGLREPLIRGFPRVMKRAFDVVASLILLILSAPLMLAIAIAIRLDSAGPIIFRQTRVGENGVLFEMLKFRTMVIDADSKISQVLEETPEGQVIHKHHDDPRVTSVGGYLRRFSLDELPQLINVLHGDMSLVGPRPELPWLVERYKPWQRKRFAVPQGITGWWQINGRSEKPMHLNTDEDLYYIYNYSLWLDIRILLLTPLAVIQQRGAF